MTPFIKVIKQVKKIYILYDVSDVFDMFLMPAETFEGEDNFRKQESLDDLNCISPVSVMIYISKK